MLRGITLTKYILIALFVLLLVYSVSCICAALYALKRKKTRNTDTFLKILDDPSKAYAHEHAKRCIERIDLLKSSMTETLCMKSFDKLELKAYYVPCGKETDKFVLLVHGYDSDAFIAFGTQIKFYKELDFDIVVIDQRACGKSEGKHVTFAVNESRDVASWCNFILKRFTNCKNIVLHGISLGGASVLFSIGRHLPSEVKCIIDDCGFDSPEGILHHVLKKDYRLPRFVREGVIFFCEIICKCKFRGVKTEDILKNTELPILFIHGALDTYVPYYMTENNFRAVKNPFEFYTVDNAHHANSFICDEEGCNNAVKRLLDFAFKEKKYER